MTTIEFTKKGQERLEEIENAEMKERILSKLDDITFKPDHFLERLQGFSYYSLRVGSYRVIVEWNKDKEIIYVMTLGKRENIYERLNSGRF